MQKKGKTDLIIIGGGILGTFHAYHAIQAGKSVQLFEKNIRPQGATVRNFGQVVPSGMNLKWQRFGRQSLEIYEELQSKTDLTVRKHGSIYFASNEEELTLLEELAEINRYNGYPSKLLGKYECLARWENVRDDYVIAGLFFPEEISIDAPSMIHRVLYFLEKEKGLEYHPNTMIREVSNTGLHCEVIDNHGNIYESEQTIICNGSDFKFLFPDIFYRSDLEVSKLQMMRLVAQPKAKISGNILTGLTIRRYEAFHECPSWERINAAEDENEFWKKWGVHILFKQALDGTVVLGDSHEYADAYEIEKAGFKLRHDINLYMLKEAQKIMHLDTWKVENYWAGMYSQCKNQDIFQTTIDEIIHIVTGIGGKGMTASPGFAKAHIEKLFSSTTVL